MARIYKTTDRIAVRIDDIVVKISPLTFEQKAEIQHYMLGFTKGDIKAATKGTVLAIKYAVKDIDGLVDGEGKPYKLEFEGQVLTDDCVSDLFNLQMSDRLTMVCSSLVGGVPEKFTGNDGNPLDGVEFVKGDEPEKKS